MSRIHRLLVFLRNLGAIIKAATFGLRIHNAYLFECFGPDGKLKWSEEVPNLVTTVGLNDILTKYFKGSGYTAAWYVGLIDNAGFTALAAGDTLASHAGWAEANPYSGNRPALTLGTASGGSIDNSASKASYAITGSATIYGGFVCDAASGTSGTLYGEAAFSGGNKVVAASDTLNVTVTLTAASV